MVCLITYQRPLVPVRMVMFDALGEHDDQRLGEVENLGRMRGDIVWTILRSCEISIVTSPYLSRSSTVNETGPIVNLDPNVEAEHHIQFRFHKLHLVPLGYLKVLYNLCH